MLTAEGGHQIDDDLGVLRMYRRLGILSMTLRIFAAMIGPIRRLGKPEHNGLSGFGKQVVRGDEPNRHDRRHLSRFGQDFLRRPGGFE